MSVLLVGSSVVTTLLIPPDGVSPRAAPAYGRALAYLAHEHLGEVFGTIYDLSTIAILWFAGASAMAGLLNLVPRYLPRYGMAPEWAKATPAAGLIFTRITFLVTILFNADVDAQGGAYATGVLVLMASAALAVTLAALARAARRGSASRCSRVVFVYTTIVNIIERPDGIKIASCFIVAIVVTSLVSRVLRSTELRVQAVEPDEHGAAVHPRRGGRRRSGSSPTGPTRAMPDEYEHKLREAQRLASPAPDERVLFLEVRPGDVSEFSDRLRVHGRGRRPAITCCAASARRSPTRSPRCCSTCRDETGKIPHAYFGWTEGNPIAYLLKFLAFGEGDTAPVTREVLRQTEPDPMRRPRIHVG